MALALGGALAGTAAVTAGCGSSSKLTCKVYDQHSPAYFFAQGPGSSQKEQAACHEISRGLSSAFGHTWSETKNPKIDYSKAERVCHSDVQGGEIAVYDSSSGPVGRQLCKSLKNFGFH